MQKLEIKTFSKNPQPEQENQEIIELEQEEIDNIEIETFFNNSKEKAVQKIKQVIKKRRTEILKLQTKLTKMTKENETLIEKYRKDIDESSQTILVLQEGDMSLRIKILILQKRIENLCQEFLEEKEKLNHKIDYLEKIRELCPICLLPYGKNKQAKVLLCGHLICQYCCDNVIFTEEQSISKCPVCRKTIQNLPQNIYFNNIV